MVFCKPNMWQRLLFPNIPIQKRKSNSITIGGAAILQGAKMYDINEWNVLEHTGTVVNK